MNYPPDRKRSRYMEWAKLSSGARFNLATSGLTNVLMAEFPLSLGELEITGGGYGYELLLERIAQHTGAPLECIVTADGTSLANHLALASLLEPGDEVVIEQPGYGPLVDLARYLGAQVRRIERRCADNFGISLGEMERAITPATRLVVLTNLHNPSGVLLPRETLQALGALAQRVGARVLVDEVYLEMLAAPDSAFSLGETFLVTSSLTKAYGLSGLRCGWIIAPAELAHRIRRLHDLFAATRAYPAERMSVVAFDHLAQFRERARTLLATNRPILDAFLDSRADLECVRPHAGTVVFPRLPQGDPDIFLTLLREKYETSVVPGAFFEAPRHFRLGIGAETSNVHAGLERLGAALDEFASR
ncbi:MAG: aminotransferase class I/II-fold pyridoxal phosphate-dependent enzyme [Verrucomicrobiota bacterium]|nr:aminotransferase class I/II-fold pyridoxal phosphate-dependent enzyme [Verrucomicrobiota bacterium]